MVEEAKRGDPDNKKYDEEITDTDSIISNRLSELSVKEIAELSGIKNGVAALAQNLSPEKFAMLMKEDSLSGEQKARLTSQRYAPIASAAQRYNDPNATKEMKEHSAKKVRDQSVKDLERYAEYSPEKLRAIGAILSNSQADALQKSGSLSVAQIRDLKNDRNKRFDTTEGAKDAMEGMNLGEIAKLPTPIFIKSTTLEAIPYGTMRSLLNDPGNLSPEAQKALTKHAVEEMMRGTDKGIKLRGFMEGDKGAAGRWGVAQPEPKPEPEESKIILP